MTQNPFEILQKREQAALAFLVACLCYWKNEIEASDVLCAMAIDVAYRWRPCPDLRAAHYEMLRRINRR